jgi:hypothetical protein
MKELYHLFELPNHSSDFDEIIVTTYIAIVKKTIICASVTNKKYESFITPFNFLISFCMI